MFAQDGAFESSAIGGWSRALGELHRRIGHRFARSEARERVERYLVGLLGRLERKNGWQIAEAIAERDPQGVQRLLNEDRRRRQGQRRWRARGPLGASEPRGEEDRARGRAATSRTPKSWF
jgi:hypothetical protein